MPLCPSLHLTLVVESVVVESVGTEKEIIMLASLLQDARVVEVVVHGVKEYMILLRMLLTGLKYMFVDVSADVSAFRFLLRFLHEHEVALLDLML